MADVVKITVRDTIATVGMDRPPVMHMPSRDAYRFEQGHHGDAVDDG
jgi:hypothetical protein